MTEYPRRPFGSLVVGYFLGYLVIGHWVFFQQGISPKGSLDVYPQRTDPRSRGPAQLPAAQVQGAGEQAGRDSRALRGVSPRPARAAQGWPDRGRQKPHHSPDAAARHGHRHLSPHLHRRRLRSSQSCRRAGWPRGPHRRGDAHDAATGDVVLVRVKRKPNRPDANPTGTVVRVLERATRHFVGTYFEREGQGYVRVDGTVFSHSIEVGDAGAKGAQPDDKVVIEMVRFPRAGGARRGRHHRGARPARPARRRYAVDHPGLSSARRLSRATFWRKPATLPLHSAKTTWQAVRTSPATWSSPSTRRMPATSTTPFRVSQDPETLHWRLAVHIADVAHFVPHWRTAGPRGPQPGHQRLSAAARHPDVPGANLQPPRQPAAGPGPLRQKRPDRPDPRRPADETFASPTAPFASAGASPTRS